MTTRMVGEPVQRVEDRRLLTGNGRYLDDLGADAVEVAVLRSPHAHARILDIDVTGALEVEGLLAIYTYEDLTGPLADPLPLLIPHPALTHGRTQYPLARDEVNYVGEAVAMVVAENRYLAEDAVERITVSYEVLPPVVGIPAARAAHHLVWAAPGWPGRTGSRCSSAPEGSVAYVEPGGQRGLLRPARRGKRRVRGETLVT